MESTSAQIGLGLLRRGAIAALLGATAITAVAAQDGVSQKTAPDHSGDGEIARYCGALAPSASEARAAYQLRRLSDLEHEVRDEVDKLEKKEIAAREWVTKRDNMMKAATEDVVSIYSKMPADSAAAQLAEMDETIAAAVLSKLNPHAAGAILSEMVPDKAAKLSMLLAGAQAADKS